MPAVGVFNGETRPRRIRVGTYEGIQDGWPSPPKLARNVWHPEPDEESDKSESWKNQYGYPSIAGFLTAAIEPVNAEGSAWPWYAGFGNHDEAAQTRGAGASSEDGAPPPRLGLATGCRWSFPRA